MADLKLPTWWFWRQSWGRCAQWLFEPVGASSYALLPPLFTVNRSKSSSSSLSSQLCSSNSCLTTAALASMPHPFPGKSVFPMLQFFIALVSCGRYKKLPRIWGLKTAQWYSLMLWRPEVCSQFPWCKIKVLARLGSLWRLQGGVCSLPLSTLVAAGIPWLVAASFQWSLWSHCLILFCGCQISPSPKGNLVIALRARLDNPG